MTRRRRAEARRRKKEKEEMSNFPSRKKWAMPGARYPGTVLAARKVRTWRMQTRDGGGMCGSAETQRGPASCHDATSYPGDESLRRSYPGDEDVGILKKHKEEVQNFRRGRSGPCPEQGIRAQC